MPITALPTPPSRQDPANFAERADDFLGALPTFAAEANALQTDVNAKQVTASNAAITASAASNSAVATANVTQWVSGNTYSTGDNVFSPVDFRTYRRKTAGAGTTDPSSDTTNWALVAGSGDVTLAGIQTLTNKTIEAGTFTNGYTEEIFAVTGNAPALSPTNGSIQTWTLTGNSTPSAGTWASGQSITLMIDDGTARTITWTSLGVTWKTNSGAAPTLNTTGFTVIALWKVGTTIYGARVGDS